MPADDLDLDAVRASQHDGGAVTAAADDDLPGTPAPVTPETAVSESVTNPANGPGDELVESADAGPVEPSGPAEPAGRATRSRLPVWQEAILLVGIAVVLAIVIKALFLQAFYIPSESMEPGLVENDRILVEKPSYWFGSPQRGDVVVFRDPGGWLGEGEGGDESNAVASALARIGLYPSGGHLVKRVIGVPGDTIVCCDDRGRITVNGVPLAEKAYTKLDKAPCYGPMTGDCAWSSGPVPAGKIFVMGDNRSHSGDSTEHLCSDAETDCTPGHEFVDDDLVVGKVAAVVWPFDHLRRIGRPDSFTDVPAAK